MTYADIVSNEDVKALIDKASKNLDVLGFTDHSAAHTTLVATRAALILSKLGYSGKETELVKIAGYMHDIGNAVNRTHHAEYGALLANDILSKTDMSIVDRVTVISAISNHDESTGGAVDAVSAALIIADKTDVRRSRVKQVEHITSDIHDRVNFAVTGNTLEVTPEKITLYLEIDENICTMYEYFDIFLGRMLMSRAAAETLGTKFKLVVNDNKVL
ncbi:MAG: HD domain-containing protein [Oscillospiraceae bacterium]|nr:HD domain-containing protein [Oscillospiraceae bacterium]